MRTNDEDVNVGAKICPRQLSPQDNPKEDHSYTSNVSDITTGQRMLAPMEVEDGMMMVPKDMKTLKIAEGR